MVLNLQTFDPGGMHSLPCSMAKVPREGEGAKPWGGGELLTQIRLSLLLNHYQVHCMILAGECICEVSLLSLTVKFNRHVGRLSSAVGSK